MASHQLINLYLLSTLLFSVSLLPTSSTYMEPSIDSSEKVSLGLYYESLCPYSANFIVNYLVKIFQNGLIDIVDLNLVPWGNAKIRGNGTVDCQHGPFECLLDTIEACAINAWPDVDEHFPFIYCVEKLAYEHEYLKWESCYEKLNLDPTPVTDCFGSGYGKQLELQYAMETSSLRPPHEYVPWVVVDGQPLYEDYENFISYICKAYKGSNKPNACSDVSFGTIVKEKANPIHPVCYTEETTKSMLSRIGSAITSWFSKAYMAPSI